MNEKITKKYPIKVGLVGCGRISKSHLEAIISLPNQYQLVSVCDLDLEAIGRTSAIIKSDNIKIYSDMREMLKLEKLDLVSICSPSGLHKHHALIAAEYNVNAICEKPMATLFEDGVEIVKAFDRVEAKIFIVKQNRLNPTLIKLKQALSENRFGSIALVSSNVFWTRPQSYYDQGSGWRGTWEFDGGAIMNQASHYIDLMQWLVGPVKEVQAYSSTERKIESEDTAVVNFKWRNGALGSMNVTMRTYPKNLEGSITILGNNGTVSIGGLALNQILHWSFKDPGDDASDVIGANYETDSVYGKGHKEYYKELANNLFDGVCSLPSAREGLKSLEIITAIYRSIRDRKPVGLPLIL